MPIENVTEELRTTFDREFVKAKRALATLSIHFDREVRSGAIAEISVSLVAKHVDGSKARRGALGHDVIKDGQRIEVKARLREHYGDLLQFNFGRHTENAHEVYTLAWDWDARARTPQLAEAYRVIVGFLGDHWATPNQARYYARTKLGSLRNAWEQLRAVPR